MSWANVGRAAFLALAIAFAGCGSSTSHPATVTVPTPTPAATTTTTVGESHQELTARLNAICARANAGLHNIGETAADFEKALSVYRTGIHRLEELKPSHTDQAKFATYVQAVKRQEGVIVRIIPLIRASNTEQIASLASLLKGYQQERVTAAIDLGAEECGH